MNKLIVIAGPTASGKTSLAVALAHQLNCPIISADSRQFYKELAIGTAKPTADEMEGVPHYFVDSHSIHHPISAGEYERIALQKVEELFQQHKHLVIVGGSGMFIDALIYGTNQLPHSPQLREKWNEIYQEKGLDFLQEKLKEADLEYYKTVDLQNPVRLIRALEIIELTGQSYSSLRNQDKKPRFPTAYFVLDHPREILYERINQRVYQMIDNGLIEEAKKEINNRHLQSLNTVGYKEVFQYLEGEIDKERAIELIQQNTRRYAKRQLTWFRKTKEAVWIQPTDLKKAIQTILNTIASIKTPHQ